MRVHQIRNATIILEYGGKRFLVDPMFAPKEYYPPIVDKNWPYNDLPLPVKDIVKDIDAVIITHLHIDHFDEFAQKAIPNDIKIFVQDEFDKNALEKSNLKNTEVVSVDGTDYAGIQIYKTSCMHGIRVLSEPVFLANGMRWEAMGVVLKSAAEPVLYLAGDTIWFDGVKNAIDKYNPDYAILNTACAQTGNSGPIIMGIEDIKAFHEYAPNIKLLASHMDNVGHATLSRSDIRNSDVRDYIYIPADGEIMRLE